MKKKGRSIEDAPVPEEPEFTNPTPGAKWTKSQRKRNNRNANIAEREGLSQKEPTYLKRQRNAAEDAERESQSSGRGNTGKGKGKATPDPGSQVTPSSSMSATQGGRGGGWTSKGRGKTKSKLFPATGWNERRDWPNPQDHQYGN